MARRRQNRGKKNKQVHKYAQLLNNVDYKDINLLRTFTSNYQTILPRKRFLLTRKQQRNLQQAVKRARMMALLPYVNEQK